MILYTTPDGPRPNHHYCRLFPPASISGISTLRSAAADQIGFSPAGRALEVEDGAMCHKSILSTRCYHSTSDGLTAAHMAQGGAAPPLSESGRTLFVWLDVGQMMRTRNPGRCDGERRWYLLAVAGSRITSRHVLRSVCPSVTGIIQECQSVCGGGPLTWRAMAAVATGVASNFQLPRRLPCQYRQARRDMLAHLHRIQCLLLLFVVDLLLPHAHARTPDRVRTGHSTRQGNFATSWPAQSETPRLRV